MLRAATIHDVARVAGVSPRPLTVRCRTPIENAAGAAMAVRHLVECGHRAIGHLTGPEGDLLTEARRHRILDALRLPAGGAPHPLFGGDCTLGSGAQAAGRWMALEERPTARFCASDEMACGFIGAV